MTDPIKALIAAARNMSYALTLTDLPVGVSVLSAQERLDEAVEAMVKAAAEARPEPAPTAPSRWDYVQGACYCRVCKQEADECECEPDRPKPAAKPSTVPVLLHEARSSVALRDNQMALFRLCDAVEALAREVRRD